MHKILRYYKRSYFDLTTISHSMGMVNDVKIIHISK